MCGIQCYFKLRARCIEPSTLYGVESIGAPVLKNEIGNKFGSSDIPNAYELMF